MVRRNAGKVHTGALSRLYRRGVAFALATAMSLSFLPATAWAATAAPITPTQVADPSDFPRIEFQTNFVRTEYGTLTGLMELAIRVGPSGTQTGEDGKELAIPVDFQAVAATLQFNTQLFKPISWKWAFDEMGDAPAPDLKLNANRYYDVQLPAKKDDTIPGTGAIAQCGVVDAATAEKLGMSDNVVSGDQALLFFKAEAYGPTVTLTEMTTLAVIRFYVNPELMEHISILRDKVTGEFSVLFDGDKTNFITTRDKLDAEIAKVATITAPDTPDPDEPETPTTRADGLTLPAGFMSVGFALDSDMANSLSPAGMALDYSSGRNEFYFVPGYDATKGDNSTDNDTLTDITIYIDEDGKTTTTPVSGVATAVPLVAPKTEGDRVLAVGEEEDENGDPVPTYSYLTNLIPGDNITFPVVSQRSFADNGDGRENMATVLFYDWDDTLIGVLVVPRNDDARALVNEYVKKNMIHPDLRYTAGSTDETTDITSLARVDTYRGKYPATAPMPDGATDATVDLEGGKYPLTNKLDYVFLKRPMVQTMKDVTDIGEPISTWEQPVDEDGKPVWDDEYPYIHGWALIPEEDNDWTNTVYTHPKNLWTTIGVGELSDYNGAYEGGYQEINDTPAKLNVKKQDFILADFDFSQKNNVQAKGTVYAVKAVYAPGENLLNQNFSYRMISEPHYDKLNSRAAAVGGAYSVDIVFERSNTFYGVVQGVGRARELALRQETTSDIRWEDRELVNATITEQNGKGKTTYSNVTVENVDEVNIQLVLSARMNKVDYYLMEAYGYNFVAGGARSDANSTYTGDAHVLDNYNYLIDGPGVSESDRSNLADEYYDAAYDYEYDEITGDIITTIDDRDGSHGFVLYGTLNNLVRITTQVLLGDSAESEFNDYITLNNFRDINLRLPNQEFASSFDDLDNVQGAIRVAVRQAINAHQSNNDEWWDSRNNCAHLTYHQLQHFVTDYINNGSATLMSKDAADNRIVNWCNLHEVCAATRAGRPTSFKAMVETVLNKSEEDAVSAIMNMKIEVALNFIYLRDANGNAYTTIGDFAKDFVAAVRGIRSVTTINTNDPNLLSNLWDAIQGWILADVTPISVAVAQQVSYDNAWWYDFDLKRGSSAVAAPGSNLAGAVSAAQKAIIDTPNRDAWLNYNANAFSDVLNNTVSPTSAWTQYTENLVAALDGTAFASFSAFKTAMKAVVQIPGLDLTSWGDIQYAIIHGRAPDHMGADKVTDEAEIASYWWHNGKTKIKDLLSLFSTAKEVNAQIAANPSFDPNTDPIWNMLDIDTLYASGNNELRFRKGFNGLTDKYATGTDIENFKNAVLKFVELDGVTTNITAGSDAAVKTNAWNQLQYYLLHPNADFTDENTINDYLSEIGYYWWRESEDGTVYALLNPGIEDTNIRTLMEAVYRHKENGNPKAYDRLTTDAAARFRLVPEYEDGHENWSAGAGVLPETVLPKYGDTGYPIELLKSALDDFYDKIPVGTNYKEITWRQIQHYLLTGVYLAADDAGLPSDSQGDIDGYWWKEGAKKPEAGGDDKTDLDYFLAEFDRFLSGEISNDELTGFFGASNSALDRYLFSGRLGLYGGAPGDVAPLNSITDDELIYYTRWNFSDLADYLKEDLGLATVVGVIDWYVLQYYAMANDIVYERGNPVVTLGDALDYYVNTLNGDWVPDKYKVESTSLLMMAMMQPEVEVEIDEETGIITTTTPDTITELPGDLVQVQRTMTRLSPAGEILEIVTVIEIYNADYDLLSEQTITMPAPEPETPEEPVEEPVCTCGAEDDIHSEDCPLYGTTDEDNSNVGTVVPDGPPVEPTVTPEPEVTESPEEELPDPETPETGEPDEETETPAPTETPEPEESQKPEGSLETMPEIIKNPDEEPEEPEPDDPEVGTELPEGPQDPETDDPNVGTGLPDGPQTSDEGIVDPPEVMVEETLPPLGTAQMALTRSAPTDYKKLTTKIVTLHRRPETGQTKLLARAGGMRMKQLNIRRIISPPGQRGIPLLLRTELIERRRAL